MFFGVYSHGTLQIAYNTNPRCMRWHHTYQAVCGVATTVALEAYDNAEGDTETYVGIGSQTTVIFNLAEPRPVDEIKFTLGFAYTTTFVVDASNDGSVFHSIGAGSSQTFYVPEFTIGAFNLSGISTYKYRFWRLSVKSEGSGGGGIPVPP